MLVMIAGRDPIRNAGGAESYIVGQALAAQRAGYDPHMLALGRRTETVATEFGTLHRIYSPARPVLSHSAILHRPWLLAALVRLLRAQPGPHVIQGHASWSGAAVEAAARLRASGIETRVLANFYATLGNEQKGKLDGALVRASPARTVSYAALFAWTGAAGRTYERYGYRRADGVAVNYDNVRWLLEAAYGSRPDVERVAYAAPAAFADDLVRGGWVAGAGEGGSANRAPKILAISRQSARKGLDVLLRALAALRDRRVEFAATILGGGRMMATHGALLSDLGLGSHVTMAGSVPNVWPYLRTCDVFAFPSTRESSGSMAVLEALQAGVPIVSAAVDGIPEDLTDGRDALLVAPGNPTELADALGRVLGDPGLRDRLAAEARATFEARFSAEHATRDLVGLFAALGLSPERTPADLQRAGR